MKSTPILNGPDLDPNGLLAFGRKNATRAEDRKPRDGVGIRCVQPLAMEWVGPGAAGAYREQGVAALLNRVDQSAPCSD